jgi:hypothetical protein
VGEESSGLRPRGHLSAVSDIKGRIKKSRATPETGSGGSQICGKSMLQNFVENRHRDGGEVVSLTRQPPALYPQEDSWYSFLFVAKSIPGPTVQLEELGKLKYPVAS